MVTLTSRAFIHIHQKEMCFRETSRRNSAKKSQKAQKKTIENPFVNGFLSKNATTAALTFVIETIGRKAHSVWNVDATFVDLWTDSDLLSHEVHLLNFEVLNYNSNTISVYQIFLSRRIQKIVLPFVSSGWIEVYQGYQQCTVTNSLLFKIFFHSTQNESKRLSKLVHFTDDFFHFCCNKKKIANAVKNSK